MNDKSCFILIHCITLSKLEKAYSLEFIRIIISTLFKTINVLLIITQDYILWKWYPKDLRIDYLLKHNYCGVVQCYPIECVKYVVLNKNIYLYTCQIQS